MLRTDIIALLAAYEELYLAVLEAMGDGRLTEVMAPKEERRVLAALEKVILARGHQPHS